VRRRIKQGKVKAEHEILHGILPLLERIAQDDAVAAVIPARIRKMKHSSGGVPFLTVQAPTVTGVKLAAHASGAIQEIFVITTGRDALVKQIGDRMS
jgi:hypothetical protein